MGVIDCVPVFADYFEIGIVKVETSFEGDLFYSEYLRLGLLAELSLEIPDILDLAGLCHSVVLSVEPHFAIIVHY